MKIQAEVGVMQIPAKESQVSKPSPETSREIQVRFSFRASSGNQSTDLNFELLASKSSA